MIKKEDIAGQADSRISYSILRSLDRIAKHYTVYPMHSASLQELIKFFKAAYAGEFNAASYKDEEKIAKRLEWANIKNPYIDGFSSTAWICRENSSGNIIGHMGIIPVSLKCSGSYYPAAWGRDLVVLPDYRQFGVGPLLVANVLKETSESSSVFLIAGVRDHVYHMYKKFGFVDMGWIPLYVRLIRPGQIIRSKIRVQLIASILELFAKLVTKLFYIPDRIRRNISRENDIIRITEITRFDNSFNSLWQAASSSFGMIIRRDADYLNWRFVDQPYSRYKLFKASIKDGGDPVGYMAMRSGQSRGLQTGIISDIFASSDRPDIMEALIDRAVDYFENDGETTLLRCDILNNCIGKILKRCGFISIASNERFMFTNIREGLEENFLNDRGNWFLDYSDSDLDLSSQIGS